MLVMAVAWERWNQKSIVPSLLRTMSVSSQPSNGTGSSPPLYCVAAGVVVDVRELLGSIEVLVVSSMG